MRKFGSLILIILLLAILYTGFWFYQAHQVKELVAYHLKEYEKPSKQGYQLKVEDVSVSGYPLNYEVNLKNPRYEKSQEGQAGQPNFAMDGALQIGTDILGKSYWIKQLGDFNYVLSDGGDKNLKKYTVKGNLNLNVDVANPQYVKAFMHPFFGFPKAFYKEDLTFNELLNELKMASYEDHDFKLYENIDGTMKPLVEFSKGKVQWSHRPNENEEEKFVFKLNLKDFEAADNGEPLLPHLKKLMDMNTDMAVNIPYILGSGKNNIDLDFDATLPQNFDFTRFFNYKNLNVTLKNLEMKNIYGNTSANFDLSLKEEGKDDRNFHVGFNAESLITQDGSNALHRHFIDSLKQKVAVQPADPENKILLELLKCCEEKLQETIPDYVKLGKMQALLDADVKVKDISQGGVLDKILVNHLNLMTKPYGFKSNGVAQFLNNQPRGHFEVNWINYKEMIHDAIGYYNRIFPLYEKIAKANNQPVAVGLISSTKAKEIEDFFKSISDDPSNESETITITLDFTDVNNPKIGHSSFEQVKQAWLKLQTDIMQPDTKDKK